MNSEHKYTNELIHESSPYLLEHAHNPVNWYPWGDKALDLAKKENKPLIISIGYAACHWCHVMERESFMDTEVASVMNEHFICIKIDREERTDLDNIYMTASQLLGNGGGWPLNVFAMPDGQAFYSGTYFPKTQWIQALTQISKVYNEQYDKVKEQAESVTKGLQTISIIQPPEHKLPFAKDAYDKLFNYWRGNTDTELGGFRRAPKFPMPVGWEFVLQYHQLTGDEEALTSTMKVLDKMAEGGIYDQAGGGFARYSVDKEWLVPHFEKMLYDNGQLVSLYAHAYQLTKKPLYKSVIEQTLDFVERELMHKNGGFYSSLNADSEGEEGKFYVWTKDELAQLFDTKIAAIICDYYNITQRGNWEEGENILHVTEAKEDFAPKYDMSVVELDELIDKANKIILKARELRIRPSTDDKILTAWNALMLKGYIDAYRALGEGAYLKTVLRNATFLEQEMINDDGSVWRNYKNDKASIMAFHEDYALLIDAYIELYQVTFDIHWLELSKKLTEYTINHFMDAHSGMFYFTSDEAKDILVRKIETADNVIQSSNSVMAHNLMRLGAYYDDNRYKDMAEQMLQIVKDDLEKNGPYYANWSRLMGMYVYPLKEVAVAGGKSAEVSHQLQTHYLPNALFLGGTREDLPLLESKMQPDKTIIYVCENKHCKLPTDNIDTALSMIND